MQCEMHKGESQEKERGSLQKCETLEKKCVQLAPTVKLSSSKLLFRFEFGEFYISLAFSPGQMFRWFFSHIPELPFKELPKSKLDVTVACHTVPTEFYNSIS